MCSVPEVGIVVYYIKVLYLPFLEYLRNAVVYKPTLNYLNFVNIELFNKCSAVIVSLSEAI